MQIHNPYTFYLACEEFHFEIVFLKVNKPHRRQKSISKNQTEETIVATSSNSLTFGQLINYIQNKYNEGHSRQNQTIIHILKSRMVIKGVGV